MKRFITVSVLCAAIGFGIATSALAVEYGSKSQKTVPVSASSSPAAQVSTIEGVITSVDSSSAAPVLRISSSNGSASTIQIDPATSIWKAGKESKAADLKAGDHVRVRHSLSKGKKIAKSVEVL